MRHPSKACLDLIKKYEGFQREAYRCPAGVWTIGYGHTRGVKKGDVCDEEMADAWLRGDAAGAATCVRAKVRVALAQHQFDALVSFVFNIGCGKFARSPLLKRVNAGDFEGAAVEFAKWKHGGGRVLEGLVRRREEEEAMFRRLV